MALSEVFNLDFKFGGNSEFLSRLEKLMERVDARFDSVTDDVKEATDETKKMADAVDDLSDSFNRGMGSLSSFGEKLKDIAKYYLSFSAAKMGAEKVWSFGMQSMDAFATQERAENQLKGVLRNRGTLDQFQAIKDYAADIQSRSIYGDEAMIKAAGELATYVKGTGSIKSMMDLLTDYAAGMTGGGAVSPEQMESLATGLGMAYDGNYMAMRRKGFDTSKLEALDALQESGGVWTAKMQKKYGSDWSKEEINDFKNIVKEAKKAGGVTEQMRVDALKESLEDWKGLSDAVNDLSSSALVKLNNKLGDLRENLGEKIYPTFNKLVDTIDTHMPDIKKSFNAIGEVFETIADTIDKNFDKIKDVVNILTTLVENVAKFPRASIGMALALKTIADGTLTATGGFKGLSDQLGMTSNDLKGLENAASGLIGSAGAGAFAGIMADVGSDKSVIDNATGVFGAIALGALAGAKTFGIWGAAVGALAAEFGVLGNAIWKAYQADKEAKLTTGELEEKQKATERLIEQKNAAMEFIKSDGKKGSGSSLINYQRMLSDYEAKYGSLAGSQFDLDFVQGRGVYGKALEQQMETAKSAQKSTKGKVNLYQTFINQEVTLTPRAEQMGVMLNQRVRRIIENQMKRNQEIAII